MCWEQAETAGILWRERSRIAPGSAPRSNQEEQPAAKRTKLESGRPEGNVESTTALLSCGTQRTSKWGAVCDLESHGTHNG